MTDEGSLASMSTVPKSVRGMRACLLCSLVKTFDQFAADGCDNCEQVLVLRGDEERVSSCTSTNYDGLIGMMQPRDSWVAKWQTIERKVPGVYAMSVAGTLPSDMQAELRDMGIIYKDGQRDRSVKK